MSRPKDKNADRQEAKLQEALDVWREDAKRTADRIDVQGALADQVLAEIASRPLARAPAPAAARGYAAAAVLLIGVGIVGTLLARQDAARETTAPRWAILEEELIGALAQDPQYEPGLGH